MLQHFLYIKFQTIYRFGILCKYLLYLMNPIRKPFFNIPQDQHIHIHISTFDVTISFHSWKLFFSHQIEKVKNLYTHHIPQTNLKKKRKEKKIGISWFAWMKWWLQNLRCGIWINFSHFPSTSNCVCTSIFNIKPQTTIYAWSKDFNWRFGSAFILFQNQNRKKKEKKNNFRMLEIRIH